MGCDIHANIQAKDTDGRYFSIPHNWSTNRHYFLFAWLAGVRNFGHTRIIPISEPRGLPDDIEAAPDENGWVGMYGDHSFSWLTSTEILAAPRPSDIVKVGIISLKQFNEWDNVSEPYSWCSVVSGQKVVVSTPTTINANTTDVQVSWTTHECDGLDYFVDEIKRLHHLYGEVRVVFGFDS